MKSVFSIMLVRVSAHKVLFFFFWGVGRGGGVGGAEVVKIQSHATQELYLITSNKSSSS